MKTNSIHASASKNQNASKTGQGHKVLFAVPVGKIRNNRKISETKEKISSARLARRNHENEEILLYFRSLMTMNLTIQLLTDHPEYFEKLIEEEQNEEHN